MGSLRVAHCPGQRPTWQSEAGATRPVLTALLCQGGREPRVLCPSSQYPHEAPETAPPSPRWPGIVWLAPYGTRVVFHTWRGMESTPCISKLSASSSPLVKHFLVNITCASSPSVQGKDTSPSLLPTHPPLLAPLAPVRWPHKDGSWQRFFLTWTMPYGVGVPEEACHHGLPPQSSGHGACASASADATVFLLDVPVVAP
jgi:hypothetical protein